MNGKEKGGLSLRFLTTDVERMFLANTGNVGIGSANPAHRLDVRVNASGQSRGAGQVRSRFPSDCPLIGMAKKNTQTAYRD